jgi:hypothetical protein
VRSCPSGKQPELYDNCATDRAFRHLGLIMQNVKSITYEFSTKEAGSIPTRPISVWVFKINNMGRDKTNCTKIVRIIFSAG